KTKNPVSARFMRQLFRRIDEVYAIHPEFAQTDSAICGLGIASFDSLLERAQAYESEIRAPFSVYIHGDFNVDNIIYDPLEKKINFIDLHRSRYMDYAQDISVFMVSIYRLQVLDIPLRRQMLEQSFQIYQFAHGFAEKAGDKTFDLRLGLGLARSFATSTRFILDKSLAKAMFIRARFLIERILEVNPRHAAKYRLPVKEIFVV
ncbi:MAG: phosphotransferase, partial [Pseudomonadota bacterium]|nr:phosphotransferase [Pseudomonadota bacterium]